MGIIPFHKPASPQQLNKDTKTGEPLYPYRPDEYQHLHIVGHLFQNGQYLPVKVFVAPEMVRGAQAAYWRGEAKRREFARGVWCGSTLVLVFAALLLIITL
jgi:hypothetical protein